ncbi:SAP domain-containing isoform 1 [Pyrenophora seminiperda CCB06]|uniref:SAP domain-containing isoform 1 n=1 Tax=Pyrenophora seminiperda CCB06 TaxID=1302712 RepID=A0A3M7MJ34_9PLEO|nr:SAP domain-containing isoform 1 [Pyrenophora seminiperda CCB06]
MPPTKRQKTNRDSGGPAKQNTNKKSSDNNKDASSSEESTKPEPHDYICIHRPFFDVEAEDLLANPDSYSREKELFDKRYKPIFEQEVKDGIYKASPSEHKDHKWVMIRKSNYCDPDAFGMNLYTDWRGWGMHEIMGNMMIEFNKAFRLKNDKRIQEMWVVISAVGFWLTDKDHIGALMNCEDGDTTSELFGLMGCSLLTALAAIEAAGELKQDSRFLDLTLVIGYYLETSHDLPEYGIEGDSASWRKEAIKYFKKGNLDLSKALSTTEHRIEEIEAKETSEEESDDEEETVTTVQATPATGTADNPANIDVGVANKENNEPKTVTNTCVSPSLSPQGKRKRSVQNNGSDPWKWAQAFKAYKDGHHPKMGGHHYDITKMSRADREAAAFDGKDPLAGIPAKALKEGLLDLD